MQKYHFYVEIPKTHLNFVYFPSGASLKRRGNNTFGVMEKLFRKSWVYHF